MIWSDILIIIRLAQSIKEINESVLVHSSLFQKIVLLHYLKTYNEEFSTIRNSLEVENIKCDQVKFLENIFHTLIVVLQIISMDSRVQKFLELLFFNLTGTRTAIDRSQLISNSFFLLFNTILHIAIVLKLLFLKVIIYVFHAGFNFVWDIFVGCK